MTDGAGPGEVGDEVNTLRQALARLDALEAEAAAVRAVVTAALAETPSEDADDDLEPLEPLIDTTSAAARFNYPADTLRKWARREGCGVKRAGRWLVSVPRVRKRLGL
jgi:hypothetical protein